MLAATNAVAAEDAPAAKPPDLLTEVAADGTKQEIRTSTDWTKKRQQILAAMQEVMGPLPDDSRKVPLAIEIVEEETTDRFIRRKITFGVEKGDRLAAYLFLPTKRSGKLPAVLCLHPTNRDLGKKIPAGLGGSYDRQYALHLAERGYVTLAPDYVGSGDSKDFDPYAHGYISATMKGIWNHMRCVDLLQSLPEVDPERIGVIGHSLGGHNSMFVAVFDERIQCIVSNCGFNSFPYYMQGKLQGWSHSGYMPRIATHYDCDPQKMPFDFPEVVAALAPRPFLASAPLHDSNFAVEGVRVCIAAAKPVYALHAADEKLTANYPDCGHDFPDEPREVAYAWLDRWLKADQ